MSPLLISLAAFVGVAALVAGVAMMFRGGSENKIEERLDVLAGVKTAAKADPLKDSVLAHPLDAGSDMLSQFISRFGNLTGLLEQADVSLTQTKFLLVSGGMGLAGAMLAVVGKAPAAAVPLAGVGLAVFPLLWLMWRRKKRLKAFAAQLPDALELMARALRAGHSLAAGFNLVQTEMPAPIGVEFGRVFEEQNLGIPLEDALLSLADRVPNMDLKFFSTAVILQRQTGGDLAEILNKIGHLVRERFKIWGQVQALTGEGRLSGIVLLALPPVLFLAVYRLNPDYIMLLFKDELGTKMLAGGVIMQVLGALVIRKIINIKV